MAETIEIGSDVEPDTRYQASSSSSEDVVDVPRRSGRSGNSLGGNTGSEDEISVVAGSDLRDEGVPPNERALQDDIRLVNRIPFRGREIMLEDEPKGRVVEGVGILPRGKTWGDGEVSRRGYRRDRSNSRSYRDINYYNVDLITKSGEASFILDNVIENTQSTRTQDLCMHCHRMIIDDDSASFQSFKLGTVRDALQNSERGCQFCTLIILDFDKCEPHISNLSNHLLYAFIEASERKNLRCVTINEGKVTNLTEFDLVGGSIRSKPQKRLGWGNKNTLASPNSPEMVKVVHRWLTDCLESHDCGSGESTELPTRLLDIDSGTDNIRLFSPSAKGISEGKYVALSYCWGSHENFITTSKNYKTRSQGFSLKSMPRTLRDAVTLTRDLGCRYIWIDALCIIQGSDENALRDWAVESSLMNRVYGNSFITIAAASSNNCNGGIFAPRSCPLLARTNQDNGTKTEIITAVPCHRHRRRAEDEPLHGRAWALQEHILSRRVLMYNVDDISFHCDHGMEIEGDGAMYARGTIDRFPSRPKTPQISDWITAVVNYSSRSLTNHEDKLPAMAGIAQHYQLLTNFEQGRYLAGLWEHSLLFTLLWGTMTKTLSTMNQGKPKSYRAPSWSWASVDGRIWFQYDESSRKYFIYTATIIQCTIEVATANPFGQVASGDLVISGPVKKATGFTCEYTLADSFHIKIVDAYHHKSEEFVAADVILDDEYEVAVRQAKDAGGATCLLVQKPTGDGVCVHKHWCGLVLVKVPSMEATYIRIGIFKSGWIGPDFKWSSDDDLQGIAQCKWWDDAAEETVTII